MRERGVALKFNALAENLAGKRVIMIDDSLVRGTTAGPLVKLVRDAGATEVHLRITCPPITHACHFGVDMGHDGDLMASRLTRRRDARPHRCRQPRLPVARRDDASGRRQPTGYCNACFTGQYPIAGRRGAGQAQLRRGARLMRVLVVGAAAASTPSPGPASSTGTRCASPPSWVRSRPPTSTS